MDPAPEPPGELTTNDDQNFGIKGIEHHLTTLKAGIVSKEIKAIVKAHKGVFNLDDLIDQLAAFIRAEFPDEPQPYSLARWFAKQFEHYKKEKTSPYADASRRPEK